MIARFQAFIAMVGGLLLALWAFARSKKREGAAEARRLHKDQNDDAVRKALEARNASLRDAADGRLRETDGFRRD